MSNQFDTVLENRLSKIKNILGEKAKQYQRNDDRYHNFRKIGQFEGVKPELALWHLVMKHIAALSDYVNDLQTGKAMMPREQWDEKIGDIINYLILLEGMIDERLITKVLKKMSDRAIFTNTITDLDKGMPRSMSACERFGMTWGCKIDCPAFWDGNCKCAGENVDEFIKDCDEEMIAEMQRLYPSLLVTKQTSLPETKDSKEPERTCKWTPGCFAYENETHNSFSYKSECGYLAKLKEYALITKCPKCGKPIEAVQ